MGDWIHTRSGRRVRPLDLSPEDVHLPDIAHALSLKVRWSGQCERLYSVAEHSIRVAEVAQRLASRPSPIVELHALLHDAHEAYLADMPTPVKRQIPAWHAVEAMADKAIFAHFGLLAPVPPEVKLADQVLLWHEARTLFADFPLDHLPGFDDPTARDIAQEATIAWQTYEPWEWSIMFADRVRTALEEAGLAA